MKVPVQKFMQALTMFEAKVLGTMTTSINQFAAGVAMSRMNGGFAQMLVPFTDADGMVDVDAVKSTIDAGLEASNGTLVITPDIPPLLRLAGVSINDITIKRNDFDEFFRGMEGA